MNAFYSEVGDESLVLGLKCHDKLKSSKTWSIDKVLKLDLDTKLNWLKKYLQTKYGCLKKHILLTQKNHFQSLCWSGWFMKSDAQMSVDC